MNGVSASIAIDGVLIACLLLAVLLLLLALFDGGRRADEALADLGPLPEYEADVPVDRWDDPDMDRQLSVSLAISHGVDAAEIARVTAACQARVKDQLAERRASKR